MSKINNFFHHGWCYLLFRSIKTEKGQIYNKHYCTFLPLEKRELQCRSYVKLVPLWMYNCINNFKEHDHVGKNGLELNLLNFCAIWKSLLVIKFQFSGLQSLLKVYTKKTLNYILINSSSWCYKQQYYNILVRLILKYWCLTVNHIKVWRLLFVIKYDSL